MEFKAGRVFEYIMKKHIYFASTTLFFSTLSLHIIQGHEALALSNPPLPVPSPMHSVGSLAVPPPPSQSVLKKPVFVAQANSLKAEETLQSIMEALDKGEGYKALRLADNAKSQSARMAGLWLVARSSSRDIPAETRFALARDLSGWPTSDRLYQRAEEQLWREHPSAATIRKLMGNRQPESFEGKLLKARERLATGDKAGARLAVIDMWHDNALSASAEKLILKEAGSALTKGDHLQRAHYLLYRERVNGALRLTRLLGKKDRQLIETRAAIIRQKGSTEKLLGRLDKENAKSPHALFMRAQDLRKKGKLEDAAKLIMKGPRDPNQAAHAEKWWDERKLIARDLLEEGNASLAYDLIATRAPAKRIDEAEAEFQAGWIALQFLKDPKRAELHFMALSAIGTTPLTQSRAAYWLARAFSAQGKTEDARQAFATASTFAETFYGQAARSAIGAQGSGLFALPVPTEADKKAFQNNPMVQAAMMLENLGEDYESGLIMRHLAETIESPPQLVLLRDLAESNGDHSKALSVGKIVAGKHRTLAALAFPTRAMPNNIQIPPNLEPAVVYAIARQESAFNPEAVSSAGAKGLLQLLPGTAKQVARTAGLGYSRSKLTSDPAYNATLGAHFLSDLIDRYDGSYILAFAAYNAGPGRIPGWIERFGDPRKPGVDTIKWIESIPFSETRNYVMRCLENLHVYRTILASQY
jgi:soluble lytic murein transglycosylase